MPPDQPLVVDTPSWPETIRRAGVAIGDLDPSGAFRIPMDEIENILQAGLVGSRVFAGLPIKTRAKQARVQISGQLGYQVPKAFKRVSGQARLQGQDLEVFVQKSTNLQVWNNDLVPGRRYTIIALNAQEEVVRVSVVDGEELIDLGTSNTKTRKHQARIIATSGDYVPVDTKELAPWLGYGLSIGTARPTDNPKPGEVLPLEDVARLLSVMVGTSFDDDGSERVRGDTLHREAARILGYQSHADNGQFPDIPHQLLEVKVQFSPTIDLGQVDPCSVQSVRLDHDSQAEFTPRHCDVRYVVFVAEKAKGKMLITGLTVATGQEFFKVFKKMGGKGNNSKQQITLPMHYFTEK